MVFVVGARRSGTLWVQRVLAAHPGVSAVPTETYLFSYGISQVFDRLQHGLVSSPRVASVYADRDEVIAATRELCDVIFRRFGEREDSLIVERTPWHANHLELIGEIYPDARIVHVIRDGRDVALSRWKRTLGDGEKAPAGQVAEGWQRRIRRAQKQGRKLAHYLELRYEDLVTDTEPNLRRIAEFLELEWDPVMLTFYERAADRMSEMARDLPAVEGKPTRPGDERMQAHAMTQKPPDPSAMYRWKERMSPEDVAAFDAAAGELLSELGYEVGTASNV
jgi:hypothetical protein